MKKLMLIATIICLASIVNAQSNNGVIPEGTVLVKNKHYFSPNGKISLCYQSDGNLVVYKHISPKNIVPLWNSGRYFSGKCIFQNDGNLVIYYDNGKAVWNAWDKWTWCDYSTMPPISAHITISTNRELRIQDDGNVVIYSLITNTKNNKVIRTVARYHTNTAGR